MKNLLYLMSGSILAQLITLLFTPIITRIFSPEEFGEYMIFLAFTSIFMSAANARYDILIVTVKEKELPNLVWISLAIGFGMSFIASLIFLFLNSRTEMINLPSYTMFFIFLTVFSYGLINVLIALNNRNENFRLISYLTLIRSLFQNIGSFLFGLGGLGYIGLIMSYVLGQIFGIKKQAENSMIIIRKAFTTNFLDNKKIMLEYRNQPLYSLPSIMVNSASYTLIIVIISSLYGALYVGFYTLALRLLGLPLNIISGNISKIVLKRASDEYKNNNSVEKTFVKYSIFMLILSIPIFTTLYIISPFIDEIFGPNWVGVSEVVMGLLLMFAIRFVVSSVSPLFIILNKQFIEFVLQSFFIIVSVILAFLCKKYDYSFSEFIYYLNLSYSSIYIIYFLILYTFSMKRRV